MRTVGAQRPPAGYFSARFQCIVLALAVLSAALLPTPARAAVTVLFPKPGSYTLVVNGPKPGQIIAGPTAAGFPASAAAPKTLLDTGKAASDGKWTLDATDTATGNEARVAVPKGPSPRITLAAGAFTAIARVAVDVTDKKGNAPTVAAVTLTDGKGIPQTATLRPDDNGEAVFHDVASGDGAVRVQQGDAANQQTITVRLPLQRKEPTLKLTADVALPDGMQTAAAKTGASNGAANGAAGTAPAEARPPAVISTSNLLGFLIALAAVAGIGFFVLRSLKARGITAETALAAAGVQLPDDPEPIVPIAAPAPPPVDPGICAFCGSRKEPNGPCAACAIGASAPANVPASTGQKRLVAVSGPRAGSIFPLAQTATVGRDAARTIAVTEDASLSRHHATLDMENGGATVTDNGSSNGTWVNGRRVDRADLRAGDEVTMGASRFRYED